jgi:AraC-like DNA-binding protein
MNFISIIILMGIVQGVFIGLLLSARKSGNRKANRILSILFFNFSVSILYYYFHSTGLFYIYPHLLKTTFPTTFLYGPLLYFYTKTLTNPSLKWNKNYLLHSIPFIMVLISNIPFYIQDSAAKLSSYMQEGIIKSDLDTIQSMAQVIHISVYIVFAYLLIKKHELSIKDSLSVIDKVNLRWLKASLWYFFIIFFVIVLHLILIYFGVDLSAIYYITVPVLVTIFIFVLGYNGLKQTEIVIQPEEKNIEKKYERSSLSDVKSEEYLRILLDLMKTEKPYLDNDITLQKLSEKSGISPHNLSQILNERLGQNFYDFINKYRIEEAQKLLLNPSKNHYTILGIAIESGFNSKSTFNTCFKKYTGLTPSSFKKENNKSLPAG